jgi:pimeloyl-ACP methyl ester carboxylesterase
VKSPPRRRNVRVAEPPTPPPSPFLLALEGRALFEWASLALSWPWLPEPPRGDGHPVLVLPGLVSTDASMWPLRKYLERCGYAVHPWELGFNCGPRDGVVRKLLARMRAIEREHGRTLSLVGWSLGGAMARALAVREPERVRSVVTLGSPLTGDPAATNASRLFEFVSGTRIDDPRLRALMRRHPDVPITSFLSRSDGVVSWRMSMLPSHATSENIEVTASHFGLGANPAVLWAVAERLSQPEGAWKPFDHGGMRSLFFRDPGCASLLDATAT